MPSLTLRLHRVKRPGWNPVELACRHNFRAISAEIGGYKKIDSTRSHLNKILIGGKDIKSLRERHQKILSTYTRKIRKDAVTLIEAIFCPSFDFEGDFEGLCLESLDWLKRYLRIPILSAVTHHDERLPHMHVLMVPLKDGKLSAKDVIGYKNQLYEFKKDFFEKVGKKYSFTDLETERRLPIKERIEYSSRILDEMIRFPEVLTERRYEIERAMQMNPLLFLNALNISPIVSGQEEM
jgi:hypothetical protein